MVESLPTGRAGQALAVGVLVFALAAVMLGIVQPLIDLHSERSEALERRTALAQRMEALAASLPELERQAAAVAASSAGEQALLDGDSDAKASASLQERLQTMASRAGARLSSVETLPGEEAGPYRRIRLRVAFNATWPGLVALLKEIHTASPALLVDELQMQPALHRISTTPGMFDVSCAIFAYRAGAVK